MVAESQGLSRHLHLMTQIQQVAWANPFLLMFYSQLDEGRQGKYTFSGNADIGMGQS
jgi:hypothetical protein